VELGKKLRNAHRRAVGGAHRLASGRKTHTVTAAPANKPVFMKPQPLGDPPAARSAKQAPVSTARKPAQREPDVKAAPLQLDRSPCGFGGDEAIGPQVRSLDVWDSDVGTFQCPPVGGLTFSANRISPGPPRPGRDLFFVCGFDSTVETLRVARLPRDGHPPLRPRCEGITVAMVAVACTAGLASRPGGRRLEWSTNRSTDRERQPNTIVAS
jgi:hypothetical protein